MNKATFNLFEIPVIAYNKVFSLRLPYYQKQGVVQLKTHTLVGGGVGMGNTCKFMADSCQCMAKITTIL